MAAPVVSSVSPNQGPASGGTTVVVTGSDFTGALAVRFGAKNATSFTVNSSTQITAVTPSGTGAVGVTVTTSQGTSTQQVTFTYVTAAAPTLTNLTPNQGPATGGTTVTLTGTNLTGATAVSFGGTPATSYTVNSSTQITATAPPNTPGAAPVTVTTPSGTSNPNAPQAYFFYAARPALTAVAPPAGSTAGGTAVTLTGTDLLNATAVRFDGVAALSFTVDSATQITAVTPPHAAGTAQVTVTTPGGTSDPIVYSYLASPTLSTLVPDRGPANAVTVVTLTGTNLTTATDVKFGTTPASFTVVSPTQITAVAPTGPAGPVSVRVTTPAGTSGPVTYTRVAAPVI